MGRSLLVSLISAFVFRSHASKSKLQKSRLQVLPTRFHAFDNVSVQGPMFTEAKIDAQGLHVRFDAQGLHVSAHGPMMTEAEEKVETHKFHVPQISNFENDFTKEMVSDKPTEENYRFHQFPSRIYEFKYRGQVISMVHAVMLLAGQQEFTVQVTDREESMIPYNLVTDLGVNEVELAAVCEAFRKVWRSAFVEAGKELAGVSDQGLDYESHFLNGEAVSFLTPYFDARASVLEDAFQTAFIQWKTSKVLEISPCGIKGCISKPWPGAFSPFLLDDKLHQLQTIPFSGAGKLMLIQSLGRHVQASPKSFEFEADRETFGAENCNRSKLGPLLPANYCNRAAMHLMVAGNDDTVSQTLNDIGVLCLRKLAGSTMVTYKEKMGKVYAEKSNLGNFASRKFHLTATGLGDNAAHGSLWIHWKFMIFGERSGDCFQIVPEWLASAKDETLTHRVSSTWR